MAQATIKMPDKFMSKLSNLGNKTDEIIENVLEVGAEVVLEAVKTNLSAVIGKDTKLPSKSTGELEKALGKSPVWTDNNGNSDIKVGFAEPRSYQNEAKGKRSYYERTNAMIANVLEYGRHGQEAKPFLAPAKSQSRTPCKKAMIQKFEEEIKRVK